MFNFVANARTKSDAAAVANQWAGSRWGPVPDARCNFVRLTNPLTSGARVWVAPLNVIR